ncbi:MAG TPA: hypothetical protein VF720_05175 [Candidatus Eisenbacteria bacterium]
MDIYRIQLNPGDEASIDVTDKETLEEIEYQMKKHGNERPRVEYLADEQKLALHFGDADRVDVDVSLLSKLMNPPDGAKTFVEAKVVLVPYRYDPNDPPPPDTMCPC